MEKYISLLKNKKVLFGLIVVVLILLNAIKGCGSCDDHDCDHDHKEEACTAGVECHDDHAE